jgi:hypothetical protein
VPVDKVRVMLDSNAFDALALDDAVRSKVERATIEGRLELIRTHIQDDEIEAIKNDDRRQALLSLTTRIEPTAVFVLDHSRLGLARLGSDEANAIYNEIAGPSLRHVPDAIIAVTAHDEGIPLVTNETGRLPAQCSRHGIETMSTDELLARLEPT